MAALLRTICFIGLFFPTIASADDDRKALVTSIAARHSLKFQGAEREITMRPEPLLIWSNPVRGDTTGGVFLWRDGERPVAYGGVYMWKENGKTLVSREFHSLTEERLIASFDGQAVWAPTSSNLKFNSLKKSVVPAKSAPQRIRQIKRIAADFEIGISQHDKPADKLRALTTPIYRYQDKKSNIVDGAVIAFCQGNDPEALLIIEAIQEDDDTLKWRYAFARSTAWAITATLNDELVYGVGTYRFGVTPLSASFLILVKQEM